MRVRRLLLGESLKTRMKERSELHLDELYAEFDPEKESDRREFEFLWQEFARILHIEPGKLRLDDRFGDELCASDGLIGVNDDLESLVEWSEYVAAKKGIALDFANLSSLYDLLKCLLLSKK